MSKLDLEWPESATHYDNRDFVMPAFMRRDRDSGIWEYFGAHGWKVYGPMSELDVARMAKRPEAWSGEGLPPVGIATCEYRGAHQYDLWTVVNIFAHWGDHAFVDYGDGWRAERDLTRFRKIRTPEQIAIELREKSAIELFSTINWNDGELGWNRMSENRKDDYRKAIDSGYRKQAAK